MRVLIINSVCGIGSTGRICAELAENFERNGDQVKIAYGRSDTVPEKYRKYAIRIGNNIGVKFNALKARLFDNEGLNAIKATERFLEWASGFDPDLLWLHNLHGYYVNYELLFKWIKSRPNMQVKWTLHDCWAFTGHCTYFSFEKCYRWETQCCDCPQIRRYPKAFKDNSVKNFKRKKAAFTGVKDMTVITPSKWLADLVGRSFLKEYKIDVCYNTIDTSVFKPTPSDFRQKYGLEKKKIILGVASVWNERKGFSDFLKLSKMLDDEYCIVLVGLSDKQIKDLPENIVGVTHTNNATELAEIYSAADVFVNLTYEDNYPTVNLESQACGTPCITYRTGGSVESVPKENVVEQGDLNEIVRLLQNF